MVKNNEILVNHGERKELMKLMNTTYPTIKGALSGRINSDFSKKIRKIAIERGGIEVEPKK